MSTSKTWPNGETGATPATYSIPAAGELNWASLSDFLIALADGAQGTTFQKFAVRKAVASPITVSTSDCCVVSDLTTPGAVAVSLPAGANKQVFYIVDGKGDATTNNITITPDGSETIAGGASLVLGNDSEGVALIYNSSDNDWKILGRWNQSGSSVGGFTADKVIVSDGSGNLSAASTSTTQVNYLSSATGTTGTTSSNVVFSTSPVLTTPNIGTPVSGVLTNCTGLVLTSGVTGVLPVANGGTNSSTALNNNRIMVSSAGAIGEAAAITASRVVVSDGSGLPTAASTSTTQVNYLSSATGTTGTTSSNVVFSNGPFLNSAILSTSNIGTPAAGTLTNCTGLPLTTGVTGTLPVANGGTGVTTSTGTGSVVLSASPSLSGTIDLDGAVVVNESGADADFRVEGDTDANLLFCDASTDTVSIGSSGSTSKFYVNADTAGGNGIVDFENSNNSAGAAINLRLIASNNGTGTYAYNILTQRSGVVDHIHGATSSTENWYANTSVKVLTLTASEATINEDGGAVNFRVEGDTDSNLLFCDASTDTVKIGSTGSSAKFYVNADTASGTGTVDFENSNNSAGAGINHRLIASNNGSGTYAYNTIAYRTGVVDHIHGATSTTENWYANTSVKVLSLTASEATINEDGGAVDFRVEGDTDTSLLLCDASTDRVGVGGTPSAKFAAFDDGTGEVILVGYATSNSYVGAVQILDTNTAAGTGFNFLLCRSDLDGTPDTEFSLRGDGNAFADGSWSGSGADYAEYMESFTGADIPVGKTVVLEGDKVREFNAATDNVEDIIGVTRPKEFAALGPVVKGNSAWNMWSGKYQTDKWGRYITEEYDVTDKHGNKVKARDKDGNPKKRRKLNPAFDPSAEYTPRDERAEWVLIGLVGQVPIEEGQSTRPSWRKMRPAVDGVEWWFIR